MHLPQTYRPWFYLAGALACYAVMMFTNPAREALRDGFRCLGRYRRLWSMLALFGMCYAAFQLGVDIFCHYYPPEGERTVFQWSRPWYLPASSQIVILKSSLLPALEGVAGLFNVLITMFPFSAVAALLLLVNWHDHDPMLLKALRRRFGFAGWLIHLGILLCAVAALVKPLLYTPLYTDLGEYAGLFMLQLGFTIDWLSFLFEILFGVCMQIYLILMVYAWVRGLHFTRQNLFDFAIRRFSFVMKWSALVMLVNTPLYYLPRIMATIESFPHRPSLKHVFDFYGHWVRPVLALLFIAFCGIQIILVFHSESLGRAFRDHFRFLRKDWWPVAWFMGIAFLHFYVLNVLNGTVNAGFASLPEGSQATGFGGGTAVTIAWRLFYPLLSAFVAGWLLASWVCLYKRSEAGRVHAGDWIKY